jgi:hypothetical protein
VNVSWFLLAERIGDSLSRVSGKKNSITNQWMPNTPSCSQIGQLAPSSKYTGLTKNQNRLNSPTFCVKNPHTAFPTGGPITLDRV